MKLNELEITAATFDNGPGRATYRARITHNGRTLLDIWRAPSSVYDWQSYNNVGDDSGPVRAGVSDTVLDALTEGLAGQVDDVFGATIYLLREERRQLRNAACGRSAAARAFDRINNS